MPDTDLLTTEDLLSRFRAVDDFLLSHQHLWRPKPFTQLQLDWEAQHPELSQWLRARSLAQADAAHNQPHLLAAPEPFPELAHATTTLSQLPALPERAAGALKPRLSVDIPGRKWQQIQAFGRCLQFNKQPQHWLDWCAGKGHLGRYLAHDQGELTCLERDASLVASGQRLSDKQGLPATHIELDVMHPLAAAHVTAGQTPVALHACGDLHSRLMQLASAAGCEQLAIAPCCYNRTRDEQYQPLSPAARASALQLSRDDLGLLQCETVTAGLRVRKQRDLSMARRLGFDLLQREVRGSEEYLNTPPLPSSWLQRPFSEYCLELARLKNLNLSGTQDWPAIEAAGKQRLAVVRNLELLRNLFRRPLEIWLILDRALYLNAQGYHVRLGSFCDTRLTPRNLLLLAERP